MWDGKKTVRIANRYELDSQGIDSRFGVRFSALDNTGPGDHPAFYTRDIG